MSNISSCASSTAPPSRKKYDVFLSFRGEDTRRKFISHLYAALCRTKEIQTYKDGIIGKGEEVWPSLVEAINDSFLCIVVFSKYYAASTWCLRELTYILESKEERLVIPVFYEIDPSHIRKQTGTYREAFEKHETDSKLDEGTVQKWKAALEKAANFSGWDSESMDYRDESEFIQKIVEDVKQKLVYRFGEYKNSMMQSGPAGICPDFNGMARDGNSLSEDQQSPSLSPWLNGGVAQMNPADIMPSSGEYLSSSSSGLPQNVQMAQANASGSTSLSNFGMPSFEHQNFINQMGSKTNRGQYELEANEQLQLPLTKKVKESTLQPDVPLGFALELNTKSKRDLKNEGIQVGGSSHKNQHEQESFLAHKGMEGTYLPTPSNWNPDAES